MNGFAENLRKEVLLNKFKGVTLENDLRNLDKVYASGAAEAVVFYSARILEVILKDAHQLFFGSDAQFHNKQPTLADIEKELVDYNLLMQSRYYWAKGLRLLGNEVRHSLRRIRREEADCALIYLEFILVWYFCEFPIGPRQTTIYKGQSTLSRPAGNLLLDLAWTLDSSRLNLEKLKIVFGPSEQEYIKSFAQNVTFPLLMIEIFIAQGDHSSADRLVKALDASSYSPKGALKDRFLQLKGLLLSREGRLQEALQTLEGEYTRLRNDRNAWIEVETVGILAGVYKRLWDLEQRESFLTKSHETYIWGWRKSNNTYLGINAATTALWLDKQQEAKAIAKEVKSILDRRRRLIQQKTDARFDLNYWDMVTLAEANLLAKDLNNSIELYQLAFSKFQNQPENIDVTRKQLAGLVGKLSLDLVFVEVLESRQ